MSRRPENIAPAHEFYNDAEAAKYAVSSRMATMQTALAQRCLDLLALPDDGCPRLLLDVGCGTGISGAVLARAGHHWLGADLSAPMLHAALDREADGDLVLADAGNGIAMRTGVLDGAISVSALQWLCCGADSDGGSSATTSTRATAATTTRKHTTPVRRLNAFFAALYAALRHTARAALQFYPDSAAQLDLITSAATRAGFSGGLLVDYPNSAKAKKYYLVLTAGPPAKGGGGGGGRDTTPRPLGVDGDWQAAAGEPPHRAAVQFESRQTAAHNTSTRRQRAAASTSRRDLVISKKDRRRRQGHSTKEDTKYTGRKRRNKF